VLPGAGMYYQPGRLIHCDDVLVHVQNIDRNILGVGAQRRHFRRLDIDLLTASDYEGSFLDGAVHEYTTALDPILQPRPAKFGHSGLQHLVKPFPDICSGGSN
jgi:hypothetical protein